MAGAGVFLEEGAWRGEGSPAQTVSSPVRTTSSPAQGRCRTSPVSSEWVAVWFSYPYNYLLDFSHARHQ